MDGAKAGPSLVLQASRNQPNLRSPIFSLTKSLAIQFLLRQTQSNYTIQILFRLTSQDGYSRIISAIRLNLKYLMALNYLRMAMRFFLKMISKILH